MQIESLILCQVIQRIHVPMNAPGTGVGMGIFYFRGERGKVIFFCLTITNLCSIIKANY